MKTLSRKSPAACGAIGACRISPSAFISAGIRGLAATSNTTNPVLEKKIRKRGSAHGKQATTIVTNAMSALDIGSESA